MNSITVDVPRDGTWIELVPRAGAASGQAVVVVADDVEIRLPSPGSSCAGPQASTPKPGNHSGRPDADAKKSNLKYISERLLKLRPTTRKTATNSIKAMFQFQSPMSDEEADTTLNKLCRRRLLTIDDDDRIVYPHS